MSGLRSHKKPWLTRWSSPVVLALVLALQVYHVAFKVTTTTVANNDASRLLLRFVDSSPPRVLRNFTSDGFGACLMIKEDNELLYEWIAYHYTNVQLRYLVVGSDYDNTEDPAKVLARWKGLPLKFWVIQADDFASRHGNFQAKQSETHRQQAHHGFVHRQKGFLTTCLQLLKQEGVKWTALIDSDEFLAFNHVDGNPKVAKLRQGFLQRQAANSTVLDHLIEHEPSPCLTIPRLLFGALENQTCALAANSRALAQRHGLYNRLSTIRFVQHAAKNDFQASKFGKTIIDLSRIDMATISSLPKNIHRPFREYCGPAAVAFESSPVYLRHYIGSWERYSSRTDSRRNRDEWEQRAYFQSSTNANTTACDPSAFQWLATFLETMGQERALYLLGKGEVESLE